MFDFFREMGEEFRGIDSASTQKKRMEKKQQKKLNRFIFSDHMKLVLILLNLLYIFTQVSIMILTKMKYTPSIMIFIIAIIIVFSLIFGKKKGEIIAIIGMFIFVSVICFSTIFL